MTTRAHRSDALRAWLQITAGAGIALSAYLAVADYVALVGCRRSLIGCGILPSAGAPLPDLALPLTAIAWFLAGLLLDAALASRLALAAWTAALGWAAAGLGAVIYYVAPEAERGRLCAWCTIDSLLVVAAGVLLIAAALEALRGRLRRRPRSDES